MEKKLLEAAEKTRTPPPPAPKEKQYVPPPPPPEEHHYYYCEFPPEIEPQPQGKQRDAPWRDHPNFRWTDQNQGQPPQSSTQQVQPSEGQPNWPARIQDRSKTGGNRIQGVPQGNWSSGPQGNWSSGGQPNWSSRQPEANWGYRQQGPQSSNQGTQPNNQMVSYVPPHQRGNQHPGNQQHIQSQYQQEHCGQSEYPQPNHGGGPPNQRYNRHPNDGQGDMLVPHHLNDAMREIQEAQKEQRAALEMLTKQLSQVAMSLGELRGNEGKIPATV
ncbi:basic salivary proline-rich protein 1-like [Salvia splendens]|uniref:basic salivary proline-rich protein 1-like n=1 Tax=Salvia splendens TaxID=180675 RepID=UPI001C2703CB|nr:basic salivary proline-rich protein 1-like [Salvia splendens]